MSMGNTITITGNLTADPELRFTPSGVAVTSFVVAHNERVYDRAAGEWKDGDAMFMRCIAWKHTGAENIAESLTKGARVVVTGKLKQRSYETKQGESRTVFELEAEEVAASLRYSIAQLTKVTRNGAQAATPAAPGWPTDAPAQYAAA